jgi:hypothetical protein
MLRVPNHLMGFHNIWLEGTVYATICVDQPQSLLQIRFKYTLPKFTKKTSTKNKFLVQEGLEIKARPVVDIMLPLRDALKINANRTG